VFIYNIFPELRSLAGGEKLIMKICEESLAFGHRVGLAALSVDNRLRPTIPQKLEWIEVMPSLKRIRNHYFKVLLENLFAFRIAKQIPAQADIVCFHRSPSLGTLWYFKKVLRRKTPTLYYSYEPPRFAYDLQEEVLPKLGLFLLPVKIFLPLFRFFDKKFARLADRIIVFNNYMKEWLEDLYQRPITSVGPLGTDIPKLTNHKKLKEILGLSPKHRVILTVNRLHPRKRVDLLIKAMPIVLSKIPEALAIIVGIGPEEEHLRNLAKNLNLNDSVVFTGFVPENEIAAYYENCEIYIHLAKQEPFGLTVIEAQAYGKPVITVAEGGPKETVLDGKTGFLIEAKVDVLANFIIQLLKNNELRIRFGGEARKHIKDNFDWRSAVQRYLRVCEELKNENT